MSVETADVHDLMILIANALIVQLLHPTGKVFVKLRLVHRLTSVDVFLFSFSELMKKAIEASWTFFPNAVSTFSFNSC